MRKFNYKTFFLGFILISVILMAIITGYSSWVIGEKKVIIPTYNFEDLFEQKLSFTATYSAKEMSIDLAENGKINIKKENFNIYYLDNEGNEIAYPVNAGIYKVKIESKTLLEADGVTKRAAYVNFIINKATPTVNVSKLTLQNTSGISYITTDTSPSSITLVDNNGGIYHNESTTKAQVLGTITMEEKNFTIGTETRNCTFTPTDTNNFNSVNFTYDINTYAMVKFYNEGNLVETQYIEKSEMASKPSIALNKDKYVLIGWRIDGNSYNFDFEASINENIDLNAHWGHSVILMDKLTGTQIGETQYIDHGQALSSSIVFPSSSANYQYSGAYVWEKDGTSITNDYIVNENIQITGSRDLRIYPTVNVYYKDRDNYATAKFDFVSTIGVTTYTNVTYDTAINIRKQIRLVDSVNGFYMSPTDSFDWSSLGTSYGTYYGNENYLVYYDTSTYAKLTIVVLCVQAAAIVSTGSIENTQNLNFTAGTFYSNVTDAFSDCESASSTTYLRVYGEMNFASNVCLTSSVNRGNYNVTVDSVAFKVPTYSTNFDRFALDRNITLNSNVTVILPYAPNDTSNNGYLNRQDGQAFSNGIHAVLTIKSGVTLNVAGTMTVGAVVLSTGTIYDYSLIMNNGTINLTSSNSLNAYGFIKGQGIINTTSGVTITDVLKIYDWPGGANGTAVYNDSGKTIFPINCYSFHNISCKVKIVYGSSYKGYYSIYASRTWADGSATVIGSGGLFEISNSSGYIIKSAEDNPGVSGTTTNINTSYTSRNQDISQREIIEIHGNFKDNSMTIDFAGIANISTSKSLPLPVGFMNIRIMEGTGNLSVNSYKFYPGSVLYIAPGATVNFSSGCNVVFYENFDDSDISYTTDGTATTWWYAYKYNHAKWYTDENKQTSQFGAQLIVDGIFNCNGNFGGLIKTNSLGAQVYIASGDATINKIASAAYDSKGGFLGLTSSSDVTTTKVTTYAKMNMYNGYIILPNANTVSTGNYYSIGANSSYGWRTDKLILYYDLNGGYSDTSIPNSGEKASGESGYIIQASDIPSVVPTRDYYTFGGWCLDKEGTIPALGENVFASTTIYAKWTPIEYTITYNYVYNGCESQGEIINPNDITYTYESSFGLLAAENGNLVFAGWYTDQACTNQINEITNMNGNLTLYGLWYPEGTVTITINYQFDVEDEEIRNILIATGISIDKEPDKIISSNTTWQPIQMGTSYNNNTSFAYYFDCWYFELECTTKFNSADFAAMIESMLAPEWEGEREITLYGIVRNKNRVIFEEDPVFTYDGKPSDYENIYLYPGQSYTLPTGTENIITDESFEYKKIVYSFAGYKITGTDIEEIHQANEVIIINTIGDITVKPERKATNYYKVEIVTITKATVTITATDTIDGNKTINSAGSTLFVKEGTSISVKVSIVKDLSVINRSYTSTFTICYYTKNSSNQNSITQSKSQKRDWGTNNYSEFDPTSYTISF